VSIAGFGVRKPVPVNLLMAGMIIAGAYAGLTLRKAFFPEVDPETAVVSLVYPGASPEEIEETLAIKVEDALADLDEVDKLITTISEGGGGITVEFREGIGDVDKAVDEVERAIDALQDLPQEAEEITVRALEANLPVIRMSLYGDTDEAILKQTIRTLRDEMDTLPGMGDIQLSGIREYEVRVDADYDALIQHGISLPQLRDAISAWMAEVPGGTVRSSTGNINIRTMGVEERSKAIRDIVVKATPDGQAIRVSDIADVQEYFVDEQLLTRFRGKPAASMTIFKVGDQDIVKIAEMVRAYTDARMGRPLEASWLERRIGSHRTRAYELGRDSPVPLPPGTAMRTNFDLARFVEGRLDLLTRNALAGAFLVFTTLLLFLNWRVAWWVGVGLVTAIAGTLVFMQVLGVTLNLLTMFGLIVVLGLLVDDAIVVAENIQARHDRGEPSLQAAERGADQVMWPVCATVITSVVAFLPLTFIKGEIGDLLGALPVVVAIALGMSLVESLLIMPSHMAHSLIRRDRLDKEKPDGWLHRFELWRDRIIFDRIVPSYERLLRKALKYHYVAVSIALATFIICMGLVLGGRVKYEFLPDDDAETIAINVRMPIGTPIEQTTQVVQVIEAVADAQPEKQSTAALIGQRDNTDNGQTLASGSHLAQVFIELQPVEKRDKSSVEVISAIREGLVGRISDVERISYTQLGGGPGGADISYRISGGAEAQRVEAAENLKNQLRAFDGVYDIADDKNDGQRELQVRLRPGAAALGFTTANVAERIRGALFGLDAHVFSQDREDIDVRVRLDEDARRSLLAITDQWLVSPRGDVVPLSEVAEITEASTYATIKRINRKRAIEVSAATAVEVSPEDIVAKLTIDDLRAQYPTLTIETAGRQENQQRAFRSMPVGFLAAALMIYVTLAWLFSSYTQPIAVMFAIPFSFIGAILGHLVLGYSLTFLSLIGFFALSGIVVNDSLILVEFHNSLRAKGQSVKEALVGAGKQRLRAIFLTTVTTVLGLTPLMLEQSYQARFLIPMAISIAFGLMSATFLILLILPCLIVIVDDIKRGLYFLWFGMPRPDPARQSHDDKDAGSADRPMPATA